METDGAGHKMPTRQGGSAKRSYSVQDGDFATCPFRVLRPQTSSSAKPQRGKRKTGKSDGLGGLKQTPLQICPFSGPARSYIIEPNGQWLAMEEYHSFVLSQIRYYKGDFVFVVHEESIKRRRVADKAGEGCCERSGSDRVACIHEIRASDEAHVYARVCWMYWPCEIPPGTRYGKKKVEGRQPYHGANELIASNHMDVINVIRFRKPVEVDRWDEEYDEEIRGPLYWRQEYDHRRSELSSLKLLCRCRSPADPDQVLVGCMNTECGQWMHEWCLVHDILMQSYQHLRANRTCSKEGAAPARQACNDLLGKDSGRDVLSRAAKAPLAPWLGARGDEEEASGRCPYQGLFEAKLATSENSTRLEVRDLRSNIQAGKKVWTERVHCLICKTLIP